MSLSLSLSDYTSLRTRDSHGVTVMWSMYDSSLLIFSLFIILFILWHTSLLFTPLFFFLPSPHLLYFLPPPTLIIVFQARDYKSIEDFRGKCHVENFTKIKDLINFLFTYYTHSDYSYQAKFQSGFFTKKKNWKLFCIRLSIYRKD